MILEHELTTFGRVATGGAGLTGDAEPLDGAFVATGLGTVGAATVYWRFDLHDSDVRVGATTGSPPVGTFGAPLWSSDACFAVRESGNNRVFVEVSGPAGVTLALRTFDNFDEDLAWSSAGTLSVAPGQKVEIFGARADGASLKANRGLPIERIGRHWACLVVQADARAADGAYLFRVWQETAVADAA
jgi:hypothetical protein